LSAQAARLGETGRVRECGGSKPQNQCNLIVRYPKQPQRLVLRVDILGQLKATRGQPSILKFN
jgi:hypothetical protein